MATMGTTKERKAFTCGKKRENQRGSSRLCDTTETNVSLQTFLLSISSADGDFVQSEGRCVRPEHSQTDSCLNTCPTVAVLIVKEAHCKAASAAGDAEGERLER